MEPVPPHVEKNREAWTRYAPDFFDAGRRSWSEPTPSWGIWSLPEAEVGALGDLSGYAGKDVVELGCGTAYFSAWFAKMGARPVGVDITPAQLANARTFQAEFGIDFPLIEASAEAVPLPDASFDVVFSEYGASIWCDPARWIPEAARLLRPGGRLIFLRYSTLAVLCAREETVTGIELARSYVDVERIHWMPEDAVEFCLPPGKMIRLLRELGFRIEALHELIAPPDQPETRFDYITVDWAKRWPSEEIWAATREG